MKQVWLLCAVAVTLAVPSCSKAPGGPGAAQAPPAQHVTAVQPVQREVSEWDHYHGRLEAVDMVEIRARVSGYLESVKFKDGAEVKKGDLLFTIDPGPYRMELDRAQAELNQGQTRLELASNDLARAERLLKAKAISEEDADSRNKAKRQAEAALESLRASAAMAKLNLDYTQVTAPIDGRIARRMVTEGNLVNGNQGQSTMLTTIVSVDPIYCYFDADETAILRYQQLARDGKQESLRGGRVPCELELGDETGYPHKGVLDFVDNQVNPSTGTLRVRGIFDNPAPGRALQPGFFARVRVPGTAKYSALLIPDQAVGTDQSQKSVFVVNDQDIAEYRVVKLGPLIDGLRVVREGVKPNEWVVVTGLMTLRPGAKVIAARGDAPAAQTAAPAAAHP